MSANIKETEDEILKNLKQAENIYQEAKKEYEEAKSLYAQLHIKRKYISDKEKREIEFDLNSRKQKLEKQIELRKTQTKNHIDRQMLNFKTEILSKLNTELKNQFISMMVENQQMSAKFTDIAIHVKSK
ncbi:MAG: hypothetical protein SFT93_01565 [Rickettsiaceae bacterium]|nr:hypothetical protein [Rickettsiaceae bacterium]